MENEADLHIVPKKEGESKTEQTPESRELDRIADDAAQEAGKREQHLPKA